MEDNETQIIDMHQQALVTLRGKESDMVCIIEDGEHDGKIVLRQISTKSSEQDIQLIQSSFNGLTLIELHLDIIGWCDVHDSLGDILKSLAISRVTFSRKTIPKLSNMNLLFGNNSIHWVEYPLEIIIDGWADILILHELFRTTRMKRAKWNLTLKMMCLFNKLYGVIFYDDRERIV